MPVLAVHSQGDEIVSIKSVQELQRRLPETQVLMLPHSRIFCIREEDAQLLRGAGRGLYWPMHSANRRLTTGGRFAMV